MIIAIAEMQNNQHKNSKRRGMHRNSEGQGKYQLYTSKFIHLDD